MTRWSVLLLLLVTVAISCYGLCGCESSTAGEQVTVSFDLVNGDAVAAHLFVSVNGVIAGPTNRVEPGQHRVQVVTLNVSGGNQTVTIMAVRNSATLGTTSSEIRSGNSGTRTFTWTAGGWSGPS